MNSFSFISLLLVLLPSFSEQTAIIFDDPTVKPSSLHYAFQICTSVRTETCCEPLSLKLDDTPSTGWWFHAKRATYLDLPLAEPLSQYLAVFTYGNGRAACRGKVLDLVFLVDQDTWQYKSRRFPYLTGATLGLKSEPVALMYDVYPDIVNYKGTNYTDNNRGDGVYYARDGRKIYGRPFPGKIALEKNSGIAVTS